MPEEPVPAEPEGTKESAEAEVESVIGAARVISPALADTISLRTFMYSSMSDGSSETGRSALPEGPDRDPRSLLF
ncbi:hypothetical protein NWFMUON74_56850 [Nocardia wallacei]|uniref:Uncharacterized protein n=1 Tax=Nocardia wallacei TaxID=480035 RepID=A0A7G1KUP6_9NOCA|nr:hypothetical protein NWFMUON74_56850 [Nocardia wallacei]